MTEDDFLDAIKRFLDEDPPFVDDSLVWQCPVLSLDGAEYDIHPRRTRTIWAGNSGPYYEEIGVEVIDPVPPPYSGQEVFVSFDDWEGVTHKLNCIVFNEGVNDWAHLPTTTLRILVPRRRYGVTRN